MKEKTRNRNEEKPIDSDEETPLNRDSVKKAVFDIAADMFSLNSGDIEDFEEMELEYDANCDTLDIVELMMSLEEEFDISINDDESTRMVSFGDCIDLVWSKIASEQSCQQGE